jgi:glycosyltransferase involved in cell wall biosynthesis
MAGLIFSVVIPVYRNLESLPDLLAALAGIAERFRAERGGEMEAVFVVDGSPDASWQWLAEALPRAPFPAKLIAHSRNFGSFAAIRTGLAAASAEHAAAMAADLQEPPELMLDFHAALAGPDCDVVVGRRLRRDDPWQTSLASGIFWSAYRAFVQPQVPKGGVDIFGCNRRFREELLKLGEANSSLVGLIFWLGFRRREVTYERRPRQHGKSAWSLRRKLNYLLDSVFAFTDLPVKVLTLAGATGMAIAAVWGLVVLFAQIAYGIDVRGYTATMLAVLFFGGLNLLATGIIGSYSWRAYDNTKARPLALVMDCRTYEPARPDAAGPAPGTEPS